MYLNFAQEIDKGLSRSKKALPSRFFYDATGDKIFQQIMKMPEYYPTPCEFEILNNQQEAIRKAIAQNKRFNLVELGAGDGYKTKVLLRHFVNENTNFKYFPVDISGDVLKGLQADLQEQLPSLSVETLHCEYFEAIEKLNQLDDAPKVLLFLGGNLGNFTAKRAAVFFTKLQQSLKPGDRLLTGIDLKKDPRVILNAYNDEAGITSRFNLNLLTRINRELDGEFDLEQFKHFPNYNPVNGECRSYLISQKEQEVYIGKLGKTYHFDKAEPIHTEISKKYSYRDIEKLAAKAGFKVEQYFTDSRQDFTDALWVKA